VSSPFPGDLLKTLAARSIPPPCPLPSTRGKNARGPLTVVCDCCSGPSPLLDLEVFYLTGSGYSERRRLEARALRKQDPPDSSLCSDKLPLRAFGLYSWALPSSTDASVSSDTCSQKLLGPFAAWCTRSLACRIRRDTRDPSLLTKPGHPSLEGLSIGATTNPGSPPVVMNCFPCLLPAVSSGGYEKRAAE